MPCYHLTEHTGSKNGFICCDHLYQLSTEVWMAWHPYCGPTFFRDKDCEKLIKDWFEKPEIVVLFDKWKKEEGHQALKSPPEPQP